VPEREERPLDDPTRDLLGEPLLLFEAHTVTVPVEDLDGDCEELKDVVGLSDGL